MSGWPTIWIDLSALAALVGLVAYALFGGADFGGGVWDLFAAGERKKAQRLAIQKAMGPVWEANHVWLIFVLVVLFTCFPRGYAVLAIALFLPFHLALLGIMLRGASFVFRSYQSRQEEAAAETSAWGIVFGVASLISPLLLGTAFGIVTEGAITLTEDREVVFTHPAPWLSPYSIANGLLALSTCAYLGAVYLTNETGGQLREDFRLRAIIAGTATAFLAGLVLLFAWQEANWFFRRLLSWRAAPIVALGLVCFAGSAWSVFTRRYRLSRLFAAGEIALLLLGWAVAQHPYLVYPDIPFADAAAPQATLQFMVLTLPFGALVLIPSLVFLFRVFKSHPAT
ncbi:MAG: cytochrome d ubiquinol oxidase subunit II [Planctomycetes bacterium]|nr:cytochrome d ubiquinol oxidase subunit II [Planctomycetota bacterium]